MCIILGSIYLIRHGQASFGADNYDVLSALGAQQAEIVGDYLIETGVTLTACYSGEMRRQKDTALGALKRFTDARLPADRKSTRLNSSH